MEIFYEEEDYSHFKGILRRYVLTGKLVIFHYSLIPNRYYLEAELERSENISSIMSGINRAYTHYYHKKYKTAGYLWQGRFISKPIEKDEYLMLCGGYIEMNSVKARIVSSPEEYEHSSSRYYVLGERDDIIIEDPSYHHFGVTTEERQERYLHYLVNMDQTQAGKELLAEVIRSKEFRSKLCKKSGRLVPKKQGRPLPGINL